MRPPTLKAIHAVSTVAVETLTPTAQANLRRVVMDPM
jgi:hypothetical protein